MTETVLIVEDDPDLRPLLEFVFEKGGYETVLFEDGSEAWEYLETADQLPDCLVLDLLVPGIDGMEFLERRAKSGRIREIPVLILTAWVSEDIISKVFDRDADDYITKPFRPEELLARVRKLLR